MYGICNALCCVSPASGCLYACGANGEGQLGLDESEAAISSPRRLHSMPTCNVKMLSCGADHSALLTGECSKNRS